MRPPDYQGAGLVNLVAELERRLTGTSPSPPLHPHLAGLLPPAPTYLLFLFDGLGDAQLDHPWAGELAASRRGALDAPFPTTTTTALASLVTGLPPSRHGLLGYQLWIPEVERVVNTLQWTTLWGEPVDYPFEDLLPSPNLWERLGAAGLEPITVQPGQFAGSPLTRALYRGARFEEVFDGAEMVEACLTLAARPGRLVLAYLPQIDVAAHTEGQASGAYEEALVFVSRIWEGVTARLPGGAVAVGVADHGHVDVPPLRRLEIPRPAEEVLTFYGDTRMAFVRGDVGVASRLAAELSATWVPLARMLSWWGPGPRHPAFDGRAPDGALAPRPGHVLLHRFSDKRLIGAHGGLTEAELRVPLLVATPGGAGE